MIDLMGRFRVLSGPMTTKGKFVNNVSLRLLFDAHETDWS